jgi:hypothetical protein
VKGREARGGVVATNGLRVVSSSLFVHGEQRMKIALVHKAGHAKPYRVFVQLKGGAKGAKVISSGHTALSDSEAQGFEDFDWACDEARKKGWQPGRKRGGGRLQMLDGVPAPPAGKTAAPGNGPVPKSRLLQRQDEALHRGSRP